jgi:outer membrane protein OmpA-like peptidoglycan-associated protein
MIIRLATLMLSLFALCIAHTAHAQAPHPTVPLVEGLVVVGSAREPQGDYESVRRVTAISGDSVAFTLTTEIPGKPGEEPTPFEASRTVLLVDLKTARTLVPRISTGSLFDPHQEIYEGSTTSQLSTAGLAELRATGHTSLTFIDEGTGGVATSTELEKFAYFLGREARSHPDDSQANETARSVAAEAARERLALGPRPMPTGGSPFMVDGTMTSVEPGIVPVPILVNNAVIALPARHIRGKLTGPDGDRDAEMYVLDDLANPLLLQYRVGEDSLAVVRIDWPDASKVTAMESALAARKPVDVYGIYFAFNSAEIRPQSDSTLDEIATMMKRDPAWRLTVTGHTDNIGGDASNLALSQRRAASVKAALVSRGISADHVVTGGSGASAPKATNATLEGRAQNRRVELSRSDLR